MKCKECCYFNSTTENAHEHCCFTEWGHSDYETAPCEYDAAFQVYWKKQEYHLEELTDEAFLRLMLED